MRRLILAFVVLSCRREVATSVDASSPNLETATVTSAASATPSSLPPLDDRCKRHADCEAILVFVEGDARCCPAPSPQGAAAVSAASAFLAACAELQKNRDCPVPEKTSSGRAACVAGHCVIVP